MIATGQNRPSSIVMPIVIPTVIPIVMPIVTPIITTIASLDLTILTKRPLKHSFIRIKTIY